MTGRDAFGLACVLWPGLRVPLALVDLVGELAGRVRVDEARQVWVGDDVVVSGYVDRSTWGLGVWGRRGSATGPLGDVDFGGALVLGPAVLRVEHLERPAVAPAPDRAAA